MSFRAIIGQEKAVSMLQGILKRDRLAGAYLFCGESGIGKKTAAIHFAKAVNCLNMGNEPDSIQDSFLPGAHHPSPITGYDACEVCQSCLKINAGTHPDVLVIAPEDRMIRIGEKGEANTIRFIEESLSFRPFEGQKKVIIVDDADLMNQQAANAFLKTVEEPPPDSLIILVSARPDRLPATIRSRCSRVPFDPLSRAACRDILAGKMSAEDAEQIARLSLGRPGIALSSDVREDRDWFIDLLKAMTRTEKDSWASREEMDKWFDLALTFIRDLTVHKITGTASFLINADLAETLGKTGKSVDVQGIIEIYKELGFIKTMLPFNLNKSLTWNYTASLLRKELYS
jgi:DNA polymerase III subunit delta'